MKNLISIILVSSVLLLSNSCHQKEDQSNTRYKVQGWNILSDQEKLAGKVIRRAGDYHINHLQLSHQIVMNLRQVKNAETAGQVNRLTRKAHESGIKEVCIWDHALYPLDYYPSKFRSGPEGLINLDNPEFWRWIKNDYRQMLDQVPNIDGIILTFIETGAHVEDQYSEVLKTEEEKLAAMVDTLASVIIDERKLNLYVRTFVYNRAELSSMLKCINLVKHPGIRVMTKEAPHDFFLTHPVAEFVGKIKFPTIIEFDAAHEYNGQGIITSMFPEVHLKRWEYYKKLPNVIGYVARTDRFNNTTILNNNPAEINLFALDRAVNQNEKTNPDSVLNQFIRRMYGSASLQYLKPAFKKASEVVQSTFYTLGLNINSHSRLHYNDNSSYQRHVSGKWMEKPVIKIERGINKKFHYWRDIVNHLAPASYKKQEDTQLARESKWVLDKGWLDAEELINQEYLDYVLTEKKYGVRLAREALELVKKANVHVENKARYDTLLHIFERTALTAKLYESTAKLFFGYRLFASDNNFNSEYLKGILNEGLEDTYETCMKMKKYPHKGPVGQFNWEEDIYRGLAYYNAVRFRKENNYQQGFFPYFSFGRMKEEKKAAIWQKAVVNNPEKNPNPQK